MLFRSVSHRITLIEGSSTNLELFDSVKATLEPEEKILLILDSNHTESHVLSELRIWSQILKPGDFVIVSDTIVEEIPPQVHRPRPWGPLDNPGSALKKFLLENDRFSANNSYSKRAISSFNPGGYLDCIR